MNAGELESITLGLPGGITPDAPELQPAGDYRVRLVSLDPHPPTSGGPTLAGLTLIDAATDADAPQRVGTSPDDHAPRKSAAMTVQVISPHIARRPNDCSAWLSENNIEP